MHDVLLVLIAPPALEEPLVDWLLGQDAVNSFISMAVGGHGIGHAGLSIEEQVSGRQRQIMFRVKLSEAQAEALIEHLRHDFSGSGLQYWLMPLAGSGQI